jgi:hypothetical protein
VTKYALILAAISGCSVVTSEPIPGTFEPGPGDATSKDAAALQDLAHKLEEFRTQALDKSATHLTAAGDILYYETNGVLHRRDASGGSIDYAFPITVGTDVTFKASADLVVTADRSTDGKMLYHAFDARSPNKATTTGAFPAPLTQKWWKYGVTGTTVYVILASDDAHPVFTFTPSVTPSQLTTLEASGVTATDITDFQVQGSTMIVLANERLYRVDLAANQSTVLAEGVAGTPMLMTDGVLWEDDAGSLAYYDSRTKKVRDLSAEIQAAPYRINDTYARAHHFFAATGADFARWSHWVIYTGNLGIFAFDLVSKAVAPVLVDHVGDDGRVDYRSPVATSGGMAYATGLTSSSAVVGDDGPVYATDLTRVLPP